MFDFGKYLPFYLVNEEDLVTDLGLPNCSQTGFYFSHHFQRKPTSTGDINTLHKSTNSDVLLLLVHTVVLKQFPKLQKSSGMSATRTNDF